MARALRKEVVHAGDFAVLGDDDHLYAGGIADGEVHLLLTIRGDGHAGQSQIGLAALDGLRDGIELHVVDQQLQAELPGDGRRDFRIDAGNLAALHVLIGREGRIGGHGELPLHGGGKAPRLRSRGGVCAALAACLALAALVGPCAVRLAALFGLAAFLRLAALFGLAALLGLAAFFSLAALFGLAALLRLAAAAGHGQYHGGGQ